MFALYRMHAKVRHGKALGRTLGFPTANLDCTNMTGAVANGVYVAAVDIPNTGRYYGILNQGTHPTFPQGAPTVEVHLLHWDGDLYGQTLYVEYLHFLRPEIRFRDAQALREQLQCDQAQARAWLAQQQML